MESLKRALAEDPRIAYALVFGSAARGTAHAHSDVDVAIGFTEGPRLTVLELGDLISRLEAAMERPVDVVDLESAPPGIAFRIFRDGRVLIERDRAETGSPTSQGHPGVSGLQAFRGAVRARGARGRHPWLIGPFWRQGSPQFATP